MWSIMSISILLACVQAGFAQPPDSLWSRTFGGGDVCYSVQQTADGGFILGGETSSFGAGGRDFYLVRTDANGNSLWNRTFGGSSDDVCYSVQQTSDGGFILGGYTFSFGAGIDDFYLVKTDANGNQLWSRTFGGSSWDDCYSVQQTTDGGFILGGRTYLFGAGATDFYLVKTDGNGNQQWSRTFGGSGTDWCNSVQQTTDSGFILGGYTTSFGAGSRDFYLVKTDMNGNSLWNRTFGGTSWDWCNSVQQTTDSGFILGGYTTSFGAGNSDFYLVKTDGNGNQQWSRTFGGSYSEVCRSVQQTADGGFILGGSTDSFGAGNDDFWLVKTDGNGNSLWSRTFGGSGTDWCYSVQQTADGGFILGGGTTSFGAGGWAFWLVRTGPDNSAGTILYEIHIDQVTLNGSSSYAFNTGLVSGDYLDISGHVTYVSNGQPVPNLVLGVTDEFGAVCRELRTDGQGDFTDRVAVVAQLSGFNHQVGYYRANMEPVYLSIPVYVPDEENLLRPPQLNSLLDVLNESGPYTFESVTTLDDHGQWLWTSPEMFSAGIKYPCGPNGVTNLTYWEILKWRMYSGTNPYMNCPEVLGLATEEQLELSRQHAQQTAARLRALPGAWLADHAFSIVLLMAEGFGCLPTGTPDDVAIPVLCGLFAKTAGELGIDATIQSVLTAANVSDQWIQGVQWAQNLFEIRSIGNNLDRIMHIVVPLSDVTARNIAARSYQPVMNGELNPSNLTNASVVYESDDPGTLDDLRWHTFVVQYDWEDTTYVVGILMEYDNAGAAPVSSPFAKRYLLTASPNPFNPTTTIRYDVKETGLVSLKVFDLLGREVATLVYGTISAGSYSIDWDAGDLPSGVYLCRMEAQDFMQTRKVVLLK